MSLRATPLPLPPVLRSRRALEHNGVSFLSPESAPPSKLPIISDGATYSMAQEVRWLDDEHFAVGRWDGSLSIFAFVDSPTKGPLITTAASDPTSEGVQMICLLAPLMFATSGGESQLTVWSAGVNWHEPAAHATRYDRVLGAANSAVLVRPDEEPVLVIGHANGFLSFWSAEALPALSMLETVDVRSEQPTNPWSLHNVRSLAALDDRRIICGSEDGLLSVVMVPSGEVLTQTVYNPRAQRGINAIALSKAGDLLVANCSVGRDDSNLWYFTLDASDPRPKPELRDHANLCVNPEAPQVFNFSTVWAIGDTESRFFCSTEEGALWMGGVAERELGLLGYQQVTSPLGSALSFAPDGRLVLVSHDLYEFRVPPPSS